MGESLTPRLDVSMFAAPDRRPLPKLGDIVRPDDHPSGFVEWVVVDLPKAPGPSDIADLVPVDKRCRVSRIRRWAFSLTILEPP